MYNNSLAERIENYGVGFYEQKKSLTVRRKQNKYQKQVHSQVLQDVLLRLDKAYQSFFKKLAGYPSFKKRDRYNSFTYPQYGGFQFKNNRLVLSCIGAIRIRMHRIPIGTLKRCTIIRDTDQWYACITSEVEGRSTINESSTAVIGIDLGLYNLVALSNGETIENPRHLKLSVQNIKALQRSLSRKKKYSKNRFKTKMQLAKVWRKIQRQRNDYAHKVSAELASKYRTIVFEDLKINIMVKNHSLASAIMDAAWAKLRQMTAYKVERRGGQIILVNPSGTSQKCSGCGCVVKKDLSVRMHKCPSCNLVIDRDHNAALNILKLGLERTHAEVEPLLVRRQISKFSQGSKKPQIR